ncbi:mevalonate kinase family protein [Kitasatospora cineracea]|uniref:Galactokinase n=1 Tax=Kitasatospora cineracea TaxID=88074 RepID=A0A8G1XDE4_9ACTN|nr:hypothetical protein [Kitasatospora cineracea]ROR46385.1 galactokinase [Kitasatospora cineracea]
MSTREPTPVPTSTRACLAGEDLDWIGHRSVCVAVDLPTRVRTVTGHSAAEHPAVAATATEVWEYLCARLPQGGPRTRPAVEVDASAPLNSGLSSSSALIIGLFRAFTHRLGTVDEAAVLQWSYDFEYAICHGGGMDQTAIVTGGAVLTEGRDGTLPVLAGQAPFPTDWRLVVVDSATAKDTAGHLAQVRARHAQRDPRLARYVTEADHSAEQAWRAITGQDLDALTAAMDRAHTAMRDIQGMSTDTLEGIRDLARRTAGLRLKITGAGGGGAMVGVCAAADAAAVEEVLTAALAGPYPRARIPVATAAPPAAAVLRPVHAAGPQGGHGPGVLVALPGTGLR